MPTPDRKTIYQNLAQGFAQLAQLEDGAGPAPVVSPPAPPAPAPASPAAYDFGASKPTIGAVTVGLKAAVAYVPVTLDRPVDYTIHLRVMTNNGSDANPALRGLAGAHYKPVDALLVFRPGEVAKTVAVSLIGGAEGQWFSLVVPDQVEPTVPGVRVGGTGRVTFSAGMGVQVAPPARSAGVYPAPIAGGVLFQPDLSKLKVMDGGAPDAWNTALPGHNREQLGNQEPVIYTDPVLYPGTTPFRTQGAELYLRAEKLAKPTSINGRAYSLGAAVLSTDMLFQLLYGRVSAELKLPTCPFAWPGFWLYGHGTDEIDIMEVWPGNGYGRTDSNAGMHGAASISAKLRTSLILPKGLDLTDWHEHAVEWRADWTTWFIDGAEVYRARTTCHDPLYILLDMTLNRGATDVPATGNELGVRNLVARA